MSKAKATMKFKSISTLKPKRPSKVDEVYREEACAKCCGPVKLKGGIQCKKCAEYLRCFYCSQKCKKADAARHKNECMAIRNSEGMDELFKNWYKTDHGPADTESAYRCGCEFGKPGFEVYRKLPQKDAPRGVKRTGTEDYCPLKAYKKRFVEGSDTCCQPWTCVGTLTSIMVTWLPPTSSTRFANHTYALEQRECPDPTGDSQDEPGPWQAVPEAHTGTVSSHWCQGLTTGGWYQFRVKTTGPAEWADKGTWSEPSEPARAGYADYSPVPVPPEGLPASDFSDEEKKFFMTLDTPGKVQDYLDTIPMNHEVAEETFYSALETCRQNCGHCVEGAMLGAYILTLHGHPPLMMDMIAHNDDSHNVVPFQVNGKWGCLSVSNHASLRYRNPIYKSIRELMISYADDYMNGKGERSLTGYTMPMNLAVVFGPRWATRRGETWQIGYFGDSMKDYRILTVEELKQLRPADDMMLASTVNQREWRCPDNFDEEAARRNENK